MKYFYSFLCLITVQLSIGQRHISEIGTPVEGIKTTNLISEQTSSEQISINNPIDESVEISQENLASLDPIVIEDSDYTGASKGQFSVSLMGASTYNLPINIPPGINGVAPQIGISYSSQSGNGIAGYGWNISGLSAISKTGSNKYFDGKNSIINFSSNDRFSLDGQRLILKSGVYGMDGAEYQTETYSNLKITSHGSTQSNYGPEYFKVQYPDGSIAIYGKAYNGLLGRPGAPTRSNMVYALTYITNPQNILIKYNYINDNGNLLISSIAYGYRSSTPLDNFMLINSYNSITFTYKDRNRSETAYIFNNATKLSKILDKITVSGFNANFNSYQFTYNTTSLGYERLQKITESSGDATLTKSPVTFNYGPDTTTQNLFNEERTNAEDIDGGYFSNLSSKNMKVISGNFSGTGDISFLLHHTTHNNDDWQLTLGDRLHIYNPTLKKIKTQEFTVPFGEVVETRGLNFNNILLPNQGWTTITKTSSNVPGSGTFKFDSFIYMPDLIGEIALLSSKTVSLTDKLLNPMLSNTRFVRNMFLSGDFDGDGISEIIRARHPQEYINTSYNSINDDIDVISIKGSVPTVSTTSSLSTGFNYIVTDTDGDGYDDLVVMRHQNVRIYKYNLNTKKLDLYSDQFMDYVRHKKPVYQGDFNGDGKLDFVAPTADQSTVWAFYINKDDGTFISFNKDIGILYEVDVLKQENNTFNRSQGFNYIFTDFNNDGKTDLIKTYDNHRIDRSNGNQTPMQNTLVWAFENRGFDVITQTANFSIPSTYQHLDAPSNRYPLVVFTNYNKNTYKTELGLITGDKLRIFKSKKDNALSQQLRSINEFDVLTKITYDVYDEKKIHLTEDGEDAVLPFVSFQEPMSVYPKQDLDVAPGLYLVKKVTYNIKKDLFGASDTERKQLFSYADATVSHNGKGFLGFRGRMSTNIYQGGPYITNLKDQIKNVTIFDLDNNGLVKEEYVAHSTDWANFFTTPVNYITKKVNSYSITTLSNKVFKAVNTQSVINEGLTAIQRTVNNTYDTYSNPLTVTESVTGGGETSVLNTVFTNLNSLVNDNYYIGRPSSKIVKINNQQSSKENYTYTGNLITNITKQGDDNSITLSEANQYDVFGNIIKKTISASDIQPRIATYVYDGTGRYIEKATDTEGLQTTYVYNKNNGWLLSQANPYGLTSSFGYNAVGMTISETDYLGNTTNFAYKTNNFILGNPSFVRKETNFPDGRKTTVTNNGWGNKTKEQTSDIDGNWINIVYTYDSQDRILTSSEPYLNTASIFTNFEYDKYGRIVKTVLPTGREILSSYNGLTTTVDDGVKVKKETKNISNQPKIVDDNGEIINYNYNSNGTLNNTNYDGTIISFEYDGWGRKTKMSDPSAGTYTYQYNSIGDLLQETTPNGITTHTYDSTGKITQTIEPDNVKNYIYNTDKLLDKITITSTIGMYQELFTYDNYKRIASKKYTTPLGFNYTYDYTFDNLGRELTEEKKVVGTSGTDSFKTKNIYKNGYLWKLQNGYINADFKVYNSFNERGQVTNFTLGSLVSNRSYDQYGYLTKNEVSKNNVNQFTFTNVWDVQRGNLNSRTNSLFSGDIYETFSYDSFDRLTQTHTSRGSATLTQENITYDSKGRITYANPGSYNYDSVKQYQLSSINDINTLPYYQANPLQEVTYNSKKAPLSIKQQGKENIYFRYDGFNNRTAMYYGNEAVDYTASSKVRYYSPVGDIEIDLDKTTNKYVVNIYVDGDPYTASLIQRKEDNNTVFYYLHRDYLGSILAITNTSGSIVEKRHFDAWGNVVYVQDGQNNNLDKLTFLERGYTGHEHLQGVDLINMNGRLYDAKLHRFLAPDNFIQDPSNSQNYNRYGYVLNNPLRFSDPSGEVIVPILVGIGVGIIMNGINNSANDKPFFQGAVGAGIIGGISGAVSFGIGSYVSSLGATSFQTIMAGASMHAFSGGMIASFSGGNFWSGFAAGAVSSGIGSLLGTTGMSNYYIKSAGMMAGGTLSGGVSSVLAGGNFYDGARQGFLTSALNHVAHMASDLNRNTKLGKQLTKAGYNLDDAAVVSHEYVKEMITKVKILKGIIDEISVDNVDLIVDSWNIGGVSPNDATADASVPIKLPGGTYSVHFYDRAFRSNFNLAVTLGHEMQHMLQAINGLSMDWYREGKNKLSLGSDEAAAYSRYKAEAAAYKWEMTNGIYQHSKNQYDYYQGLIKKYSP